MPEINLTSPYMLSVYVANVSLMSQVVVKGRPSQQPRSFWPALIWLRNLRNTYLSRAAWETAD